MLLRLRAANDELGYSLQRISLRILGIVEVRLAISSKFYAKHIRLVYFRYLFDLLFIKLWQLSWKSLVWIHGCYHEEEDEKNERNVCCRGCTKPRHFALVLSMEVKIQNFYPMIINPQVTIRNLFRCKFTKLKSFKQRMLTIFFK